MNVLAIVKKDTIDKLKKISTDLSNRNIEINIASNVLHGLYLFLINKPHILILDYEFKGSFIAETIGNMNKQNIIIYMLKNNDDNFNENIHGYIDLYIPKPINETFLKFSLISYVKKYLYVVNDNNELKRALDKQVQSLPTIINDKNLMINYIYSPFNKLSGDKLQILTVNNIYYGIVIDCTGHDLLAWQQTGAVEIMFKYALKFLKQGIFKNIIEVLEDVNKNLVPEEMYVAAAIFELNMTNNTLKYASAGIPSFFIKYKNDNNYKEILMRGKVLGYKFDAKYKEEEIDLSNVNNIVFTTDGLNEILTTNKNFKNDDISAFFITLKEKSNEIYNN